MASGEVVPLTIDAHDATKLGCRLPVTQDQSFHSNWTFALTAYLGMEFE